mgnify:CR=1 FL=1
MKRKAPTQKAPKQKAPKRVERFEQPDSLRVLPLTTDQSQFCLVDKQDWDWAKHDIWFDAGDMVARMASDGEVEDLATFIGYRMFPNQARYTRIEHTDGNPFNCRRVNLRLVQFAEEEKDSSACSPGTCWWVESRKQWVACVGHKYLRYFNSQEEALDAQKKAQEDVITEPAKKRPRPKFYDSSEGESE